MFGLVLTRYISNPISCLYKVGSTSLPLEVFIFLQLVMIGIAIGRQSYILNLFRISDAYLPWPRKISPSYCQTSNPKKSALSPNPSCQIMFPYSCCNPLWVGMILSKIDQPHTVPELTTHLLPTYNKDLDQLHSWWTPTTVSYYQFNRTKLWVLVSSHIRLSSTYTHELYFHVF